MRVLVIGFPTPNPSVENYTALTAPSYYDYDALVVDPESLTRGATELLAGEREFSAQDGRVVVNAASGASSVSAGEMLHRRTEETIRLLESGGTVVVLGRPNAPITGIVGYEGADRYSWLPAPSGLSWAPPYFVAAEGKNVRITDDAHPVAHLLREFRRYVGYRATFNDRLDVYRKSAHTIAVAGPGVPIAAQFPVLAGRVVVIPALSLPTGQPRQQFGVAIVEACARLAGVEGGAAAPPWTRSMAVPGLEQVEAEYEDAKLQSETAATRLREVGERRDVLVAHRRLLWATGSEFESAVRDALLLLGFSHVSKPGEPLIFEADDATLYVETEASSEAVVEWPYIRLQRRLEDLMLRLRKKALGLVVVSGHRATAPEQRRPQFTEPLKLACENLGYGILTGDTVFQMLQRAIGGASDEELMAMRRRIFRSRGLLDQKVALGEAAEGSDSGPIF
jgi:hypothetical protein